MGNLKDLLQPKRLVEIYCYKELRMGVIEIDGTTIRTPNGVHEVGRLNENLEHPHLDQHITKVYEHTQDGKLTLIWNRKDYVDWSKVPVDAKVLVKNYEISSWVKRHFAKYENGKVYTFDNGSTSFTANGYNDRDITSWDFAKLYNEEEDKES